MTQKFRLPDRGRIERDVPVNFTFNGRHYQGYRGDTLASALLANGVRLVGRSFKYHRPRGIMAAGAEEPNALVQLETGARTLADHQATLVELYEGLIADSVNCWPSPGFDVMAVNNWFHRILPSGFYYKTFMWPTSGWKIYEYFIRRAAGLGHSPHEPDPDHVAVLSRRLAADGWSAATLSSVEESGSAHGVDAVVVDRVGALADLYTIGQIAYVGGGFHAAGLHSVLEPAAARLPVLFGPRHHSSRAAADLMVVDAARSVVGRDALAEALVAWLTDDGAHDYAARRAFGYVQRHMGAAGRTADVLSELLRSSPP